MTRTAIFCFYDRDGVVGGYVEFLLKKLKEVIEYLVIVVNGELRDKHKLMQYSDILILRENKGYDICAYKEAFQNQRCLKIINSSQELIFINNSFYGPFVTFTEIFEEMKDSKADFWGITSVEKNLTLHIQSYFYVFRKKVIDGGELFQYVDKHIDLNGMNYLDVCTVFENGLFFYLLEHGYKYDAYKRDINFDTYRNPHGSIVGDGVPVLKRKFFSKEFFDLSQAECVFYTIKNNYKYDINLIIEDVKRVYNLNIDQLSVRINNEIVKDILPKKNMETKNNIIEFINRNKSVYIYGTGGLAADVFSHFFFYKDNPKLIGFVISDGQEYKQDIYKGYSVYHLSEIQRQNNVAILVALNEKNSMEVFKSLYNIENVKFLWKSINDKMRIIKDATVDFNYHTSI